MNSKFFKLNWTDVKSALVYGIVVGILATVGYILKLGDVFLIDVHALVNCFALAGLGAIAGVIVPLLTTKQGDFLGAVNVKDVY